MAAFPPCPTLCFFLYHFQVNMLSVKVLSGAEKVLMMQREKVHCDPFWVLEEKLPTRVEILSVSCIENELM